MIELGETTDNILLIRDRLKSINKRYQGLNITIHDLKLLYKFNSSFTLENFRKSVRSYRQVYGEQDLKKELNLILKSIYNYEKFYTSNKRELDQVDSRKLIEDKLKPYLDSENFAYKQILPIGKSLTDLKDIIESKSWNLGQGHPEVQVLFLKEERLKKEYNSQKNNYLQKVSDHKKQIKNFTKISSFEVTFDTYHILKGEIENDYLEQKNIFSKEPSPEFIEEFNKIFTPQLNLEEIEYFVNKIESPGKNIALKTKIRCFYFIKNLSENIKDDEIRENWILSILSYFAIEKMYFDKKKNFYNNTKYSNTLQQAFAEFQ